MCMWEWHFENTVYVPASRTWAVGYTFADFIEGLKQIETTSPLNALDLSFAGKC